jgi:trk system potassium uptake protein TrkH
MILFALMFVGACAGSTGGGIKVSRIIIFFKSIAREIKKLVHPNSVKLSRMNGKVIPSSIEHSVNAYLVAYCLISIVSVLLLSFDGQDFETTVSAVVASINNIGPGFGLVGPLGNFSVFSAFGKLVLCADMLIGRLEIFPMLILFSPTLWRRTK